MLRESYEIRKYILWTLNVYGTWNIHLPVLFIHIEDEGKS